MHEAMRGVEQRIENRLAELGMGINNHTNQTATNLGSGITTHVTQQIETSTATYTSQQNFIVAQLRLLADASEDHNRKMAMIQQGFSSKLVQGPTDAAALQLPSTSEERHAA